MILNKTDFEIKHAFLKQAHCKVQTTQTQILTHSFATSLLSEYNDKNYCRNS